MPKGATNKGMDANSPKGTSADKSTSHLESMLKELVSYKHVGDMHDMSPEVQVLLRQAEQSQAREENRQAARRLKGRRPRERRRRKESDSSVSSCTHAGGSLDNMAADSKAAGKHHKGVAGRTAEGGSCFNLSRGSFEPTLRRQRQQHGGSLEDLSAIDEATGGARASAAETTKSGGSLQNISQDAAGGGGGDGGDLRPAEDSQPACRQVVIDMDDVTSGEEEAPRRAVRALAAPCAGDQPHTGTRLKELARPAGHQRPSLEEGGAAVLATATARDTDAPTTETRTGQRRPPFGSPVDLSGVGRSLASLMPSHAYTSEEVTNMPRAELLATARKAQALDAGGGPAAAGGGSTGQRADNGRQRKHRKKEEQLVTTDSVDNYQGHIKDVDDLIRFIESSDHKPPPAASRKSERAGRREVKGRRSGEERRAARRASGKPAAAARSASLEARLPAGGAPTDHSSVFCGDLAQPRAAPATSAPAAPIAPATAATSDTPATPATPVVPAASAAAAAPALWERDGKTYVSAAPVAESTGFVQDFYSVATDSPVVEETEFLVVTRKQRRRPARAPAPAGRPPLPPPGTDGWRARPGVPAHRHAASCSAPHSEASDTDSEGTVSPPTAGTAAAAAACRVGTPAVNGTSSSASSASLAATSVPSTACSSASSWADVAKPKAGGGADATTRDAGTSTDFIDGVGAIFGDRSPARAARPAGFVRGASEPRGAMIAGAHPDEFPAIAPPPPPPPPPPPAPPSPPVESTSAIEAAAATPAPPPAARQTNGDVAPPPPRRVKRSPAVVIPTAVTVDGENGRQPNVRNIQFGYIEDASELAAPPAAAKPAPSGVDRFCRRFRSQPVDVSQFNWKEIVVFLSKVYAEAATVPGALFEETTRLSFEARR